MADTRLVRTIVCAYGDELPTSWVQVFHRFERAVEKAGLRVRVRLLPFDDLPESFEVLVVPPELEERARALATEARRVTTTRLSAPAAATELVGELANGGFLYAERVTPGEPKIVTHRGTDVL